MKRTTQQPNSFDPRVTAHFHASAALYKRWSPEGHLHFGYWRWPLSPFDRHAMLEELVHQAVAPLQPTHTKRVADLGCGYGAAARLVAKTHGTHVDAFTVTEAQCHEGAVAALVDGTFDRVTMHLRDFRNTGLPAASLDGAYALESLCYGNGHGKSDALAEAARILKPGATLSVMDGFLLRESRGWQKELVGTVARGWALDHFPKLRSFTHALEAAGFTDVRVRDLNWRMGACALHGLPLLARTYLEDLFRRPRMDALERAHLRSCGLGILLGTQRGLFRYCHVTATRSADQPMRRSTNGTCLG
ncbi:MAG TPA: class I SAM-dependent methyltransferase [Flavobacteriales bacterium]|jgi:SAM-dependent methyltransferase|nr:class I SAM-dependent methyltransferase [Flavobacteriales bacterium]